ncbi:MAG: hypothetical protein HRU19_09985 [Pseudobacteriovorax sp.]|nr:hypothetical protein [Pseudobacteriovorax sp.]
MVSKKSLSKRVRKALAVASVCSLVACGSSDDDAATTTTEGGGSAAPDPEELLTENPLSAAYPSTLALSVFPQTAASTALGLQEEETTDKSADEKKLPEEKAAERREVLQGGADADCFPTKIFSDRKAESVTCYEFDNDMNPFNNGPAGSGGTADGKHTDGEACLVAFARQEVLDATQYIDRALDSVAGMLCAVKQAGGDTELPAAGAEKDYLTDLADKATGIQFTTAKMKNLDEGIYRTHLAFTTPAGGVDMVLVYQAGATDGESSGIISYKRTRSQTGGAPSAPKLQSDPNNTQNMINYVSVQFEQVIDDSGSLRNRSEVRIASIEKTLDGLNDNGTVNYDIIPDGAENDTSNQFKFVQFDIDSETAEGNISYWRNPGGRLNEPARGFVFNIAQDETTGVLSGCGSSGAASVSIRDTMGTGGAGVSALTPTRHWHPFGGQNTDPNKDDRYNGSGEGPSITIQCFAQNETSGVYEIDYAATKAISDTTVEAEIDTHGYDVVPQAEGNTRIKPPLPPKDAPEGDFKPEEAAS